MNLHGKRIAVGGFLHETNTFQQERTTYADFAEAGDRTPLTRGPEVLERFSGVNTSIAGALDVLKPAGATLLPLPVDFRHTLGLCHRGRLRAHRRDVRRGPARGAAA